MLLWTVIQCRGASATTGTIEEEAPAARGSSEQESEVADEDDVAELNDAKPEFGCSLTSSGDSQLSLDDDATELNDSQPLLVRPLK